MKAIFNAKYYYEAGMFTDPETGSKYGISCVRVEPHPTKGVLIIATEGHVLGIWHDEQGRCSAPVMLQYNAALNRLCGIADNEWETSQSRVIEVNDNDTVTFRAGVPGNAGAIIGVLHGLLSTADFPNWRNVLPKEETPRMDINPKHVALFSKLSELHYDRLALWIFPFSQQVTHGENKPAVIKVDGRDDFIGVVMGMVPQDTEYPGEYFDLLRSGRNPSGDTNEPLESQNPPAPTSR